MEKYNVLNILKKYNLIIKKKFGQNFLTNENILNKIVDVAGNIKNKNILEIGAGPGGLTNAILQKQPKKLVSIEIDKDYYEIIQKEFNYTNFQIINADAIKINENNYLNNINVIANLPYNIGTHLLLKWMNNINCFESFTLLLQKEVVERIVAKPFTKEYGYLSVVCQALCSVKKEFDIKPTNFTPHPKVLSSVVYLKPKNTDINIKKLTKITTTLFNNRRKKIKKSLEILSIKMPSIEDKRAEELEINEFIKLSYLI